MDAATTATVQTIHPVENGISSSADLRSNSSRLAASAIRSAASTMASS